MEIDLAKKGIKVLGQPPITWTWYAWAWSQYAISWTVFIYCLYKMELTWPGILWCLPMTWGIYGKCILNADQDCKTLLGLRRSEFWKGRFWKVSA